jgi:molybdopterin biosynthesis enzyme
LTEFRDAKSSLSRRGFDHLTALDDAHRELLSYCRLAKSAPMPVDEAIGSIAAETVIAPRPVPSEAIALRDGFAVAALDTIGASAYAPAFMLSSPQWVACGDRLPQSANAILPSHAVRDTSQPIEILAQATPGDGVRFSGDDLRAPVAMIVEGEAINPLHLAVLRATGVETINVRIPRLAVIVRNDLPQGDFIGPVFHALAKQLGASAEIIALDMSDGEALSQRLAAIDAGLIVTIGGTGFGDRDCTAAALAEVGSLLVHGLAMHPGETAGFGFVSKSSGSIPVIMAPGRLESAFAVWLALVKPCLCEMAAASFKASGETLPLLRKITSNPGVSDIVLLRRASIDGKTLWAPLAASDLPWHALARAEAWHSVPPESEGYAAGALLCAEEI